MVLGWQDEDALPSQAITRRWNRRTHIQPGRVIGNFSQLAPRSGQGDGWYLAFISMPSSGWSAQHRRHDPFRRCGLLATKPYVASAAYIDRMSDYCKGCHYDKKARIGERACPFNALYWDFFHRNAETLERNPRIGMAYRQLEKMDEATIAAFRQQAATMLARLDSL